MSINAGRIVRHRFLSPHYDDIALSCGGTVAKLARDGEQPEIIVLFGEGPAPGTVLTPFAAENLRDWGLTVAEVVAARRQEERQAAALLGATASWLPFPDAIYRDDHYVDNEQLFGEPMANEAELALEIVAAITPPANEQGAMRFYAPLAIGGHVDHRHAFQAGVALAQSHWDVWFYEDLPYALRPGLLEQRLARADASLTPVTAMPIASAWETKLAAILAYPSQLERTFSFAGVGGSKAEIAGVLEDYARRVGDGIPAERFWRLTHVCGAD